MAVTFGFYNSLNNDRRYNARHMGAIFDGIINDGVFMSIGEHLAVKAAGGMGITIGPGRAWFNHTWTHNDTILPLNVEQSEVVLNRIDAVVLEVNNLPAVRANTIKIVKGTPGTVPVGPTMVVSDDVNQHLLAYISVGIGVTEITQSNITNYIGTEQTPFVTGVLETISIDDLIAQWGSQWLDWMSGKETDFDEWSDEQRQVFEDWLESIEDALDGNATAQLAAHLSNVSNPHNVTRGQIGAAAPAVEVTGTLTAGGWTGAGPFSQTISMPGVTAGPPKTKGNLGIADTLAIEDYPAVAAAQIVKTVCGEGQITVTAIGEKPEIDIPVVLHILG